MNILHLKYAVEVARTQSISKAAENLYMGQPNLSRAIKELEESLGIVIFKRTSKGITTTPDGDEFLCSAQRIVAQVDEVEELYRSRRSHKQSFSVCVPRASYISAALTEFSKHILLTEPAEISYKEASSNETVTGVARGDHNLGIVRYRADLERFFIEMFKEKKLEYETVAEFSYRMLIRNDDPLSKKADISADDIKSYIEITHEDVYVPSLPLIDVTKTKLSDNNRRIFVFEREAQLELIAGVPKTFMWVSPMPRLLLEKYGLTTRECPQNNKMFKDTLIYRKDYRLTDIDKQFITDILGSKHDCFV